VLNKCSVSACAAPAFKPRSVLSLSLLLLLLLLLPGVCVGLGPLWQPRGWRQAGPPRTRCGQQRQHRQQQWQQGDACGVWLAALCSSDV
jgi:hypothetical protein